MDVLGKHLGLFLGITALFYAPVIGLKLGDRFLLAPLLEAIVFEDPAQQNIAEFVQIFLSGSVLIQLAEMMLLMLSQAAIIHGVFRSLKGESTSFSACLETAASRWLPVLGATLLVWLVTVLGTAMCIVPGILATLIFYVAIPVVVVEGHGPVQAIQRSDKLTQGSRVQLFGLYLIMAVTGWAGAGIIGRFINAVAFGGGELIASMLFKSLFTIGLTTFQAILAVVVYYELRLIKDEDTGAGELLAVFD